MTTITLTEEETSKIIKSNEEQTKLGKEQADKEFYSKERKYPTESWKLRVGGSLDHFIIAYRKRWRELLEMTPEDFHSKYGY